MIYTVPANLNHADLQELEHYLGQMPEALQESFRIKLDMIERYPQRFARANQCHSEMSGLLGMSDYTLSRRFLRCCQDGRPCGLVKWCDYCAYVRKMKLMRGLLTSFGTARFWFLTISFQGYLSFMPGDALDVEVYWDAAVNALKMMVKDCIFEGIWWSEELHVQSLVPPLVEPHVHAIVACDQINMGMVDGLKERVAAYRAVVCEHFKPENLPDRMFRVTRPITTRTYELRSEIDLTNVIGYLIKTINLPEAYLAEWTSAEADHRAGVPWLNMGVDDIVRGFEINVGIPFWWERFVPGARGKHPARRPSRRQFGYLGRFHSRHHDFVGVQRAERDTLSRKQVIAAILADQAVEKAMGWQPQWLGNSIEEQAGVVLKG